MSSDNSRNAASNSERKTGSREPGAPVGKASGPLIAAVLDLWRGTGSQQWITTDGQSMQPLIQRGDRLLVICDVAGIRLGSIVAFRRNGRLVAHRVIGININKTDKSVVFLTKGDNAHRFDLPVPKDEVLGYVLAIARGESVRSLQSLSSRLTGLWIARTTLLGAALYRCARLVKTQLAGSAPIPGRRFLSRIWTTLLTQVLRWVKLLDT